MPPSPTFYDFIHCDETEPEHTYSIFALSDVILSVIDIIFYALKHYRRSRDCVRCPLVFLPPVSLPSSESLLTPAARLTSFPRSPLGDLSRSLQPED